MSTLVYRVENKAGRGPYLAPKPVPDELQTMLDCHEGSSRTPHPIRDGYPRYGEQEYFDLDNERAIRYCFADLASFLRWFEPAERQILHISGFHLCMIEVCEILWIGNSGQCIVSESEVIHREIFDINSI